MSTTNSKKIDFNKVRANIQKNVHYALTGELPQEDLLASAAKALSKLDLKSREKLLRAQPEVAMLETAVAVTSAEAEMINDNLLAAVSGAGWLMDIMGPDINIQVLAEMQAHDVGKLRNEVGRQERRLRRARIKAFAAENADMLLKVAPDALSADILDEKDRQAELIRIQKAIVEAKGREKAEAKKAK